MLIYLPFTYYLAGSVVVLALYYVIVWLLCFVKKQPASLQRLPPHAPSSFPTLQAEQHPDRDLSPEMYDFMDELNALLLQSAVEHASKEELAGSISRLLQKYERLKGSSFQSPIISLITNEAADKCAVQFDAEELTALWT